MRPPARIAKLATDRSQWRAVGAVLSAAGAKWLDSRGPTMGAAIAYYTAFSLAPVLVIVIAIGGMLFGEAAASGAIFAQFAILIGANGAQALETMIAGASDVGDSVLAVCIGVFLLMLSATSVFAETKSALNMIWDAPPSKHSPIIDLLRTRLTSVGVIVSLGFLLLVLMVVGAGLAAFGAWLDVFAPGFDRPAAALNLLLSLFTTFALFALIYRVLPDVYIPWREVWFGAAVSTALFHVGRWAISTYIANAKLVSTFGATTALVVILIWVYYSAQIFLFGAAVTKVVSDRRRDPALELIAGPPPRKTKSGKRRAKTAP